MEKQDQIKKVFVGMSGGVDSSLSACLLKEAGYQVTGVFIKVWQADFLPCNWRDERRDAMRVAAQLEIPFLTLDLEEVYKKEVIDYMIAEYAKGRVPNPDVMCNTHVKFGAFLDFALAHGADAIATGHYAQVLLREGRPTLACGKDSEKDQSYFLWTLSEHELAHTLFPVGHLTKSEVRVLAKERGLVTADKHDSQGLCFMGKVDVKEFLQHYIDTKKGNVLSMNGSVIGEHDGAELYTIGQRHGFLLTVQDAASKPQYVIQKDISANTLTVSDMPSQQQEFLASGCRLANVAMPYETSFEFGLKYDVVIRYHGERHPATIERIDGTNVRLIFDSPITSVSPGQFAVIYQAEWVVGGGSIEEVFHT